MEEFVSKAEYDQRIARIDDENTRQNKRIDKLEDIMDSIHKLTASVERIAIQIEQMQKEIQRQGERIETIEQEPADKWKAAGKTVLTVLLTAAVTYFISK